jgi:hypothetical protein
MVYLHTKFQMPSSSCSIVKTIKMKAKTLVSLIIIIIIIIAIINVHSK